MRSHSSFSMPRKKETGPGRAHEAAEGLVRAPHVNSDAETVILSVLLFTFYMYVLYCAHDRFFHSLKVFIGVWVQRKMK